ncbi:hypothetical protein FB382_001054 [Nocardioides ginsengisegetis]|uniref:Uncharacterized protein n=1 Tax=Nocardioides ginsengisegetis TaxID=661491 RepID=A0A7W3IY39_9ACTN|nr:hypothetical protein [Nocardioides ginsengisegetis]MBA8802763.1 hypothetical protein [Nocardioides ginsengisegetis]
MTRGGQLLTGLVAAWLLTSAISASFFFGSHAGSAFDRAFWPILATAGGAGVVLLPWRRTRPGGVGVIAGTVASLVFQIGAFTVMFFAGGGS